MLPKLEALLHLLYDVGGVMIEYAFCALSGYCCLKKVFTVLAGISLGVGVTLLIVKTFDLVMVFSCESNFF